MIKKFEDLAPNIDKGVTHEDGQKAKRSDKNIAAVFYYEQTLYGPARK